MNLSEKDLKHEFDPKKDIKSLADKWIISKLNRLVKETISGIEKYRFGEAGTLVYDFFWSQFCDWYVEISKGECKNEAVLKHVLETVLKLLHPFTPFITEVIWADLKQKSLLIGEQFPKYQDSLAFEKEEKLMNKVLDLISAIRKARSDYKVEPAKRISAVIYSKFAKEFKAEDLTISKLARLEKLEIITSGKKVPKSKAIILPYAEVYLPLSGMVDVEKEKSRIRKEIEKHENDIKVLESKLSNKGFINNAPQEIVDKEKIRLEEAVLSLKKLKAEEKSL